MLSQKEYRKLSNLKNPSRNILWPLMMKHDKIDTIKIFCFFSKISKDFKVTIESNPLELERQINLKIKELKLEKPKWSR